jgi:ABC-type nitrate/sulfonate/bicarbonate transport system substrate-binding protein
MRPIRGHSIGRVRLGRLGVAALLAATVALATGAPQARAEPALHHTVIGINSLTAIYWPTYVARDRGFFAANGIDADVVLDGSPVAGLQQLLAGSLDIAHPTLIVAVNGASKGGRFTMIGCIVPMLPYSIVVPDAIHNAADLKGRSVSLAYKSDVLTLMWDRWLQTNGVRPAEVDKIYDAQAANRYAALAAGFAQGALLNAPFDLRAKQEGRHTLVDFGPLTDGYAMSAISVRPDWLAQNRSVAAGYLRAQQQAIDFLYDPANRDTVIAILAHDTHQDPAIAALTYDDTMQRRTYSRTLDLPDRFVAATLEAAIATGDVPAGTVLPAGLTDLTMLPH